MVIPVTRPSYKPKTYEPEIATLYPADVDIKGNAVAAIRITNFIFVITYEDHKLKTYCEPVLGIDDEIVEPMRIQDMVYRLINNYSPSFYAISRLDIGLPQTKEFNIEDMLNKADANLAERERVADFVKQQIGDILDRLIPLMTSVAHCERLRLSSNPVHTNKIAQVMFWRSLTGSKLQIDKESIV